MRSSHQQEQIHPIHPPMRPPTMLLVISPTVSMVTSTIPAVVPTSAKPLRHPHFVVVLLSTISLMKQDTNILPSSIITTMTKMPRFQTLRTSLTPTSLHCLLFLRVHVKRIPEWKVLTRLQVTRTMSTLREELVLRQTCKAPVSLSVLRELLQQGRLQQGRLLSTSNMLLSKAPHHQ